MLMKIKEVNGSEGGEERGSHFSQDWRMMEQAGRMYLSGNKLLPYIPEVVA